MIDIHSHILPGVDDGARDMREAVALLRISVDEGIKTQVLTPHMPANTYGLSLDSLTKSFDKFKSAIEEKEIPIQLKLAAEVRIGLEVMELVESGNMPWLGVWEGKKVFLMEFPPNAIPSGTLNIVRWLSQNEIHPLIVHPERNLEIQNNMDKLKPFIDEGCLLQLTAGSITGDFSREAFDTACQLLKQGLVDVIASDCHRADGRTPRLKGAVDVARQIVGEDEAIAMVSTTPARLLDGLKAAY